MNATDMRGFIRQCPLCGAKDARILRTENSLLLVRCRTCSLVYLGNPPHEHALYEEYYAGTDPDIAGYHLHSGIPALAELAAITTRQVAADTFSDFVARK